MSRVGKIKGIFRLCVNISFLLYAGSAFSTNLDAAPISDDIRFWIFEKRLRIHDFTAIFVGVLLKKTTKFMENQQNTLNLLLNPVYSSSKKPRFMKNTTFLETTFTKMLIKS